MERTCEHCGKAFEAKEFEIERGGGKYCSRDCFHESRRKIVKKKCKACEKEFFPNRASADTKYCSQDCYFKNRSKLIKEGKIKKEKEKTLYNCLNCGKEFIKRPNRKGYCSRECYIEHIKGLKKRICPICKNEFEINPSTANKIKNEKCCSVECQLEYDKDKNLRQSIRNIPDEYLLHDLKRVYSIVGSPPSKADLRIFGLFSMTAYTTRWGTWENSLCQIGLNLKSQAEISAKGKKMNFKGIFKRKEGILETYDSEIERRFMEKLDNDPEILYWTKRHGMFWEGEQGGYAPDFLVVKPTGCVIVETKSSWRLNDDKNQYKINLAMQKCAEIGYKFEIITENDMAQIQPSQT